VGDKAWQRFFDGCAPRYEDEGFTKSTEAEAGFLVELLGLPPGALFVLTALDAMGMVRESTPGQVAAGLSDPMKQSQTDEMQWEDAGGRRTARLRERDYVPAELALGLRMAGFAVEHVRGGTAGDRGRRSVELDQCEIMAVARRPQAGAPESPAPEPKP